MNAVINYLIIPLFWNNGKPHLLKNIKEGEEQEE